LSAAHLAAPVVDDVTYRVYGSVAPWFDCSVSIDGRRQTF